MSNRSSARHDVSHLAAAELLSPDPSGTEDFFTRFLGMRVTHREGQSVYLRGYEDSHQWSLKVTEADHAGVRRTTFRTDSDPALERRAKDIQDSNLQWAWSDGDFGYGKSFTFLTPAGHDISLVWDAEKYIAPPELTSKILDRQSKKPLQGVPVKRIDHINLAANDPSVIREVAERYLGFTTTETIFVKGEEMAIWTTPNNLHHQLASLKDPRDDAGRLHHLAFYYGDAYSNIQAAEMFRDYDVPIELGPDRHGLGQAYYLYVIEPGGNRIELFGDGLLVLEPDWETRVYALDDMYADTTYASIGGAIFPSTYFDYMTPSRYTVAELVAALKESAAG